MGVGCVCVSPLLSSDRTRGNGLKLGQERFRLDIMTNFFMEEWSDVGIGCPVVVVGGPLDLMILEGFSNQSNSMILFVPSVCLSVLGFYTSRFYS